MKLPEEIYELVLARLAGEIDAESRVRLQAWLDESERNRELYREFCALWYAGRWGNLRGSVNRDKGWENVLLRRNRNRIRYIWSRAAVVFFVVGFVGWYWSNDERNIQVVENMQAWGNTDIKLILSSGEEVNLREIGKGEITDEGMVIRSDSASLDYTRQTEAVTGYNELIVPKCGEYRLRLPDGSSVVLNAESRLRFSLNFTGEVREVLMGKLVLKWQKIRYDLLSFTRQKLMYGCWGHCLMYPLIRKKRVRKLLW